jgi:DNA polymerase-1
MLDLVQKLKEFNEQGAVLDPIGENSRVLLIDSTNMYIRCFCATPTMNDDGDHIGGISGFLKSVGMIIRQTKPSRVICVFDGKGGSQRRRSLFENYKDKKRSMERLNRTYDFASTDDEQKSMKWQMYALIQMIECLPITVYAVENIEADDTISYLTEVIREKGGKSTIVSTDKDFLQLVSDTCEVYNPVKKKMYTVQTVLDEYHIHPNNFVLYRVIDGDKSDSIPGINGIGYKSLIKNFPELANPEKVTIADLLATCAAKEKENSVCKKLKEGNEAGIITRNMELMDLSSVQISGTTKIKILDQFNRPTPHIDKYNLTKILSENKMGTVFGNYSQWILTTWAPLTRHFRSN